MHITGTHFNYNLVCKRKLWLFANGFQQEHDSELVAEGRLIHETSYPQRPQQYQEIEIEGIKIDYYDPANRVIHEVKKSDKMEKAHEWQVKYYLYILEKNGVTGTSAILEYPKLKKLTKIHLDDSDRTAIEFYLGEIREVLNAEECPSLKKTNRCRACSYHDFCFIREKDIPADQINAAV